MAVVVVVVVVFCWLINNAGALVPGSEAHRQHQRASASAARCCQDLYLQCGEQEAERKSSSSLGLLCYNSTGGNRAARRSSRGSLLPGLSRGRTLAGVRLGLGVTQEAPGGQDTGAGPLLAKRCGRCALCWADTTILQSCPTQIWCWLSPR